MEDWLSSLKSTSSREYFDSGFDQHDILSNHHHWYSTSHARPTYCNVCREALSGVTSHGLSCEVCKCKVHKRCAAKAIANCKWTTLATVGKDIIEEPDGSIVMPHQWMEGNLPVASTCSTCKKTCGSVLRLQDWRCLWCRSTVHTACRPQISEQCPIGSAKVSVVPPTSVHSIGIDESWDVVSPKGNFSPLLVFVNSKSGDNQGIKFLRRFKQLLNPAQVFDLISTGPSLGLRLFRHFDIFRILVCSGDGSVGWVLSEIDRFNMHKQCQVAVLPLGTGNDLARVLGWGSSCDDDAHLPQILERYESASTKMLDRWSIMVFEKAISVKSPKMSLSSAQEALLTGLVTSANENLRLIVETEDLSVLVSSIKTLCENIDELLNKICENRKDDEQLIMKCDILRQKFNMLLDALKIEETGEHSGDDLFATIRSMVSKSYGEFMNSSISMEKTEKDHINLKERRNSRGLRSTEKEALQCRANSVKRAIYNVVEHSEPGRPKRYQRKLSITPFEAMKLRTSSNDTSPSSSPLTIPPINIISPSLSTTQLICLSPLPDNRRDSTDDNFFNSISLPVPRQFADSRRSSGVPESIQEADENINNSHPVVVDEDINSRSYLLDSNSKIDARKTDYLSVPIISGEELIDPLSDYRPIEVFERNLYRTREQQLANQLANEGLEDFNTGDDKCEMNKNDEIGDRNDHDANCSKSTLQIPQVVAPRKDSNVYIGESMTIIDTDIQEQSSSEELPGEPSDVLSVISNEECSVASEILDKNLDSYHTFQLGDIMQNLELETLTHIDSPETSDETEGMPGESIMDDISSVLGNDIMAALQDNTITEDTLCTDVGPQQNRKKLSTRRSSSPCRIASADSFEENSQQFGFENIVFEIDNRCDDQKIREPPIRYCSLAQFVEGNDIERKSFKRRKSQPIDKKPSPSILTGQKDDQISPCSIKIDVRGSHSDLSDTGTIKQTTSPKKQLQVPPCTNQDISVVVRPPTPLRGDSVKLSPNVAFDLRRHSSHSPSLTVREFEKEKDRRHSGFNPNYLSLDPEHMKFLNSSPAATRRISCGSLFKPNEGLNMPTLKGSKSNIFMGSSLFGYDHGDGKDKDDRSGKEKETIDDAQKKLPIINPLVRLPSWPNITNGTGFISKCLLANADTLCAAVSPLMDPDETLLEGYHEKCVMNNYFGIGIDAKISLDFHNKREEHPEKCRSRARNYMWYGVLGSKQLLQKTYKNLEKRVQLECDGQRIPLPSLQGIVILNIPSFMGGTNFWGGTKKDDIFLAPSFDDRILEVVAVFGSVQMAASRLINLQHHRIAQCQSVQINILGDEEVPIQVDGEAWLQPPGMIRILHKNRVQMLGRNRNLEVSLKQWQEKQRQHSISIQRDQSSITSEQASPVSEEILSERECYVLLNFIEVISSLVKWVKFLIISHPSLQRDLYGVACRTADALESIHPNGKLLEGPTLRTKLVEVIDSSRQLYDDACSLLRDRGHSLILREDLESKLSAALANMEMELKKCSVLKCIDGKIRAYFNAAAPHEDLDARKKSKPFWVRLRSGSTVSTQQFKPTANTRDAVSNWSVNEVVTWLEAMQMSEYVDSFVRNDIRGKELLSLGRRDLKDLGVVKVGHVKRILQAIKDLCEN
ncbi:diacylglycerol kinase eta isoform X2 [Episyrphus balteatus]|uniref:diacylglycerol kinase eta isoform X2 n=1 Tax=Episyrphus balteatus TaxID=286459 RepID=UPI002484EC24|nr:diacylglycerol kinase eta isoform X2 [Episyrphus balteatus]